MRQQGDKHGTAARMLDATAKPCPSSFFIFTAPKKITPLRTMPTTPDITAKVPDIIIATAGGTEDPPPGICIICPPHPAKCMINDASWERKPMIAVAIRPVAGPLTSFAAERRLAAAGGSDAVPATGEGTAPTMNSEKSESGRHEVVPSTSTLVSALTRPWAIHSRSCWAETGPYSLPSLPITLYMRSLLLAKARSSRLCLA